MTVLAWHFVGDTLRDGRPVPPDGVWLVHEGEAGMCESGLHASRRPSDALQYAPGPVLCLVECKDVVDEGDDKLVCRRRRIIKRMDATDLLRTYARKCALSVIHLWDAPSCVREYLETGDDSKRLAAREAAAYAYAAADADAADAADAAAAAADAATADAATAAANAAAAADAAAAAAADAADVADVAAVATAGNAYRSDFDQTVEDAFR